MLKALHATHPREIKENMYFCISLVAFWCNVFLCGLIYHLSCVLYSVPFPTTCISYDLDYVSWFHHHIATFHKCSFLCCESMSQTCISWFHYFIFKRNVLYIIFFMNPCRDLSLSKGLDSYIKHYMQEILQMQRKKCTLIYRWLLCDAVCFCVVWYIICHMFSVSVPFPTTCFSYNLTHVSWFHNHTETFHKCSFLRCESMSPACICLFHIFIFISHAYHVALGEAQSSYEEVVLHWFVLFIPFWHWTYTYEQECCIHVTFMRIDFSTHAQDLFCTIHTFLKLLDDAITNDHRAGNLALNIDANCCAYCVAYNMKTGTLQQHIHHQN